MAKHSVIWNTLNVHLKCNVSNLFHFGDFKLSAFGTIYSSFLILLLFTLANRGSLSLQKKKKKADSHLVEYLSVENKLTACYPKVKF